MRFHLSRTSTGIVLFVLAVAVCLAVAPAVFTPTGADESGAAAITFGQPTISGIQGVGFEQDIRLDPTNASAFVSRAIAWAHKKDYDKAIRDYDEAIRLDPKNTLAFYNRGLAWDSKNRRFS